MDQLGKSGEPARFPIDGHQPAVHICMLPRSQMRLRQVSATPALAQSQRPGLHGRMLGALKSLYSNSTLQMRVKGRVGQPYDSCIGLKQGCPISPTLIGLFGDKLHRYIKSHCPAQGPVLEANVNVPV